MNFTNVIECYYVLLHVCVFVTECYSVLRYVPSLAAAHTTERWGAGVETQKNVRGEVGGWGRVPFNEPYAPSLRTIYDGA